MIILHGGTMSAVGVIMLYLSSLLQLVSEFIFSCLLTTTQQYEDLKFIPFKVVTELHGSAYLAINRFDNG
jgi:hypothetical protein